MTTSAPTARRVHRVRKTASIALIALGAAMFVANAASVVITGTNTTGHVVLPDDGVLSITPASEVGRP